MREFTLQQDLEKGCVWVWGVAKEGRFRLQLDVVDGAVRLEGKEIALSGPFKEAPATFERISFGSHKAQDWDAVSRRADPVEILPALFALSQWIPSVESPRSAMFDLLERLDEDFLRAAFFGILCPRLIDDQHQGLLPNETLASNAAPIALIGEAGSKIREQILMQEGSRIAMPLPKHLSGRMVNANLEGIGLLDFEWRKGRLRRAVWHAKEDAELFFDLPEVRTFRVRTKEHEKGSRMDSALGWEVKKETRYYFDRFEK